MMGFKEYINHTVSGHSGIGETLRSRRIAQGLSLFALAHELNLNVSIIEAVEDEAWHRLPRGRERPHTRLIAERLGVDLDLFLEQWDQLPGAMEQEPHDPRREFLEKALVSTIMVCSLILLFWLIIPGPNLKRSTHATTTAQGVGSTTPSSWILKEPVGLYPVVGEVLPEAAPVNSEGVIVSMRAMDICQATIKLYDGSTNNSYSEQKRTLLVSEPWSLRVKGPFAIHLDNAGVVAVEVAGRRIHNERMFGEPWSMQFGANGEWLTPDDNSPKKYMHTAPEADQDGIYQE